MSKLSRWCQTWQSRKDGISWTIQVVLTICQTPIVLRSTCMGLRRRNRSLRKKLSSGCCICSTRSATRMSIWWLCQGEKSETSYTKIKCANRTTLTPTLSSIWQSQPKSSRRLVSVICIWRVLRWEKCRTSTQIYASVALQKWRLMGSKVRGAMQSLSGKSTARPLTSMAGSASIWPWQRWRYKANCHTSHLPMKLSLKLPRSKGSSKAPTMRFASARTFTVYYRMPVLWHTCWNRQSTRLESKPND